MKMHCLALFVSLSAVLGHRVKNVGAPEVVNPEIDDVRVAADVAVSVISDGYAGDNKLGLLRTITATSQVVAGSLYEIELVAARTDCPKLSPNDLCNIPEEAKSSAHPDYNECKVKVWDQPWRTPRYEVTLLECSKPNKNVNVKQYV